MIGYHYCFVIPECLWPLRWQLWNTINLWLQRPAQWRILCGSLYGSRMDPYMDPIWIYWYLLQFWISLKYTWWFAWWIPSSLYRFPTVVLPNLAPRKMRSTPGDPIWIPTWILHGPYMDPIWIPLWTIWILYDPCMDHIWIPGYLYGLYGSYMIPLWIIYGSL